MSEQGTCEWCGKPISPRSDPRGRRAKYCSDACRAAATRDRHRRRHAEELEAAQSQMVLPVESIEERQDSAVNTLRETAQAFLAGQPVTNSTVRLVEMARHLAKVAAPPPLQEPEPVPKISRQQRRAVQRQAKKKR